MTGKKLSMIILKQMTRIDSSRSLLTTRQLRSGFSTSIYTIHLTKVFANATSLTPYNQHQPTHPSRWSQSVRYQQAAAKKVEKFILPDIGEGINEVAIKEWQVKVGDLVQEFDSICEVESDKATAVISSRFNGVIVKTYYDVGDMAKVGQPLVDIEVTSTEDYSKEDASLSSATLATNSTKENSREVFQSGVREGSRDESGEVLALPSVRRFASENGVDLSKVKPSGKRGRILREDVLMYLRTRSEFEESRGTRTTKDSTMRSVVDGTSSREISIPLKSVQRAMFKTMTKSLKIPHFNYSDEIDMTRLVNTTKTLREQQISLDRKSEKISSLSIIIKMVSQTLRQFPQLNASIDEKGENLILKHYHNIGVAIDTPNGLVVPNIKNVNQLTIRQINDELRRIRQSAHDSKLSIADLSNGTFTLSNIGSIGGVFGIPVIVSPEIVIGAIGRTRKLPRYNLSGDLEPREIMQIVWSADHRVVDGATISRFSNLLKNYIEQPEFSLIDMI